MTMIFGQWHGGSSYAYGGVEDRECFTSYREAVDAMKDRRDNGHHWEQTFYYINRAQDRTLTPCVDNSSYIDVYADATSDDIIERIEFGPRGGIRRERA